MTLTGKIIEIGDLEHLAEPTDGCNSGMVILIPREQLGAIKENMLYCKVKIELVKE